MELYPYALFGVVFSAGGVFMLVLQAFLSERGFNEEIVLQKKDVLATRIFVLIAHLALIGGLYFILGPDGWIFQDFQHYQSSVICLPINASWNAQFQIGTASNPTLYTCQGSQCKQTFNRSMGQSQATINKSFYLPGAVMQIGNGGSVIYTNQSPPYWKGLYPSD